MGQQLELIQAQKCTEGAVACGVGEGMPSIPKILGLNGTTEREMDARKDLLMVPLPPAPLPILT